MAERIRIWALAARRAVGGRWWLPALVAVFAALHLWRLDDAPTGIAHEWREADTAMVAWNLHAHGASFWLPEVDHLALCPSGSFAPPGPPGSWGSVVGQEFPLLNQVFAWSWDLLGPGHLWPRAIILLFGCALVAGVHAAARRLGAGRAAAGWAAFAAACSPLVFFYSRKLLPDLPAAALAAWGLVLALAWRQQGGWWRALGATLCLAVAGLIKPPALCVGLPLAVWLLRHEGWRWLARPGPWLVGIGSLLPMVLWFRHARRLGGTYFFLGTDLGESLRAWATWEPWNRLLVQWPWQLWVGVPACWLLLLGAWRLARPGPLALPAGRLVLAWAAGAAATFVILAQKFGPHDYYTFPIVAPCLLAVGAGAAAALAARRREVQALALASLLLLPGWGLYASLRRYGPRYDFAATRALAAAHLPADAVVLALDRTLAQVLYRLDRRGMCIWDRAPTPDDLGQARRFGARWLAVRTGCGRDLSAIRHLLGPEVARHAPAGEDGDGVVVYALADLRR